MSYRLFDSNNILDEVMIALRFLTKTKDSIEYGISLSKETDLELVSTFVAKALVHDVKITALPIAY
jgi:hypothetical protein